MLIRTEVPSDILHIDELLQQAFPTPLEAKLVRKLRENGRFTLSLVACTEEGEIIGFALFTSVTLDGEDKGWQGLAPVAVNLKYRQQGIAASLIRSGLDSLYELGYHACFVLGDPHYYSRFGFEDAESIGLTSIYNGLPEYQTGAFRALALADAVFEQQTGLVEFSPEFNFQLD